MHVVGPDRGTWDGDHVHTIDIWYSDRRRCWVIERLNEDGHLVGHMHCCATAHDARACLEDWLRAHGEVHLIAPHRAGGARRRRTPARRGAQGS